MKNSLMAFLLLVTVPALIFSQTSIPPSAGNGTSEDPYEITTLANLYWISQNGGTWYSWFLQTADIDADSTHDWGTAGWTTIGEFHGNYDGNGHTISNLFINRPVDYIGFFQKNRGTIKNLGLINLDVTGGGAYTGGLTSLNLGTIENCFSTGAVTGNSYVGGLTGGNNSTGVTRGSYSRVNVSGGECVGSLAGENFYGGTIQNSYATGTVNGSASVGGLTGSNYLGTVTNCYSTGSSSGGGLTGISSTCNNSFWDMTTSGNSSSAGGTGKTTTEMQTQSTFTDAGWDFDTTWEMVGTNYPRLRANPDPALPVEIVSFTAAVQSGGVELRWKTAAEVNNYGFHIERRVAANGHSSYSPWRTIGFIAGAGTTGAPKDYFYIDRDVRSGMYIYRLQQTDRDGSITYTDAVEVSFAEPEVYSLDQNYPNPCNPATSITFNTAKPGFVSLRVYDVIGREVTMLINEHVAAGKHTVPFDATGLTSGVYMYHLTADNIIFTRKMTVIK